MKSLKRTLCLVLALVMVLGLFGIASATDFTDDDTIQYKEAVEVITGIGAINGMGDGTFNPKGNITRAQAAVMITRVALTAGVAADLTGISSSFTDVTVEGGFDWAIPSIEYLVKAGIINGMGDGTFNPNGEINGYAVLKMLLCVLGYGAKDEYVGHQWTLQVAVDANTNELTKGRTATSTLSASATREEVALYCFNALKVRTVSYNKLLDKYETNEKDSAYLGDVPSTKAGSTLADSVYGMQKVLEGVVIENGSVKTAHAKAGTTVVDPLTSAASSRATTFKIDTGLDLVGHYVKVYYKAGVGAADPVAYSVVDASTVVTVTKDLDTKKAIDDTFGSNLTIIDHDPDGSHAYRGVRVSGTYGVTPDVNLIETSTTAASATGSPIRYDTANTGFGAVPGTYILKKGAGQNVLVGFIAPTTYTVASVKSVTVAGTTTIAFDSDGSAVNDVTIPGATATDKTPKYNGTTPCSIYSDVAVGDVVVKADTDDYVTITKAAIAKGTVSSVKTAADGTMTLVADGTTYTKADTAFNDDDLTSLKNQADFTDALVNKNCTIYLAGDGTVVAIATEDTSTDGGLVIPVYGFAEPIPSSYGVGNYINKLQCVDMDGKEVILTVGVGTQADGSDVVTNAGAASSGHGSIGKLATVTYTYNEVAGMELATVVDAADVGSTVKVAAAASDIPASAIKIADNNYYDANTKFIFVTGTGAKLKVNVLSAPQAVKSGSQYYAVKSAAETNYTVKYVVVKDNPTALPANGIMYVPAKFTTATAVTYTSDKGPAKAYQNAAYVDGQPVAVLTKNGNEADVGFYTYSKAADGLYTLKRLESGFGVAQVENVYGSLLSTKDSVLTDDNAAGAFVTDVMYQLAQATGADVSAMKNHTSLASLEENDVIAYTYTVGAGGAKTVTGVYFVGGTAKAATIKSPISATADVSATVDVATAYAGQKVTITVTFVNKTALTADKTYDVEVTAGSPITSFTLANETKENDETTVVIYMPGGAETLQNIDIKAQQPK